MVWGGKRRAVRRTLGTVRLGLAFALLLALCLHLPASAATNQCGSARPWCNTKLSPDQRAELLLRALSQSQKISLLAGDDVLGVTGVSGHTGQSAGVPGLVPRVDFTDGTSGIRQGKATAMPDELAAAATFDPSMAELDGSVLGTEAKLKGNDVLFGPTLTIMRTPFAGRTFQSLGEDPFLAAQGGAALIDGIQSQGVIADANIYVANNQEGQDPTGLSGMPGAPLGAGTVGSRYLIDANVDQRTLHEIYLQPFEAAVKNAHVGTVMCAYNRVNGTYNCENGPLLNGVLEQQWGFKGFVLSDYGAAHNTVASLNNGLDFEPWPGVAYSPAAVTAALATGLVTEAQLDEHVFRYLRTLFASGVFDRPAYADEESQIPRSADAAGAQRVEQDAITLLENRGALLPLDPSHLKSIAVIGKAANSFVTGGGSSSVNAYSAVTPLQGITQRAGPHVRVAYNDGSNTSSAVALAKASDVAVVVAAGYETEGADLNCLTLECPDAYGNQDGLIEQVAKANPNTIVLLETGGPVLTPWRNQVKGLLEAWYPGEEGGAAIAGVLFGDTDPRGRLPVTFPDSESQEPTAGNPAAYPGLGVEEYYTEGVDVGYRWFQSRGETPAFPFGYGLSYTTFAYHNLRIAPGGPGSVATVTVSVTNTGTRPGSAVPQLYLGLPSSPGAAEPPEQLRGYQEVDLAPGQTATVTFSLNDRSFAFWDTASNRWKVAAGCTTVSVGSSSASQPLRGTVSRVGAACGPGAVNLPAPDDSAAAPVLPGMPTVRYSGA